MSTPSILRHIHLPHITPFPLAQALQTHLSSALLTHKALISSPHPPSPLPAPPPPTIITFTPTPVYTTGRREHDILSQTQRDILLAPLYPLSRAGRETKPQIPTLIPTLRGGQTTFHGPGQLVLYPILSLRSPFPLFSRGLTPRCYIHLLESCTINTLSKYGIQSIRTENPGVWCPDGEKKIAALGVHLRRYVTSYGVGLNVRTDLRWFERIVACGLVGKGVTSMWEMVEGEGKLGEWRDPALGEEDGMEVNGLRLDTETVGRVWVDEFARALYGEGGEERVVRTSLEDVGFESSMADYTPQS